MCSSLPAGPTDRDVHLVVTPETVELVDLAGSQTRPGPHLPGRAGELRPTARAGEMVGVEGLALHDHSPALSLAGIRPDTRLSLVEVCALKDYCNIVIIGYKCLEGQDLDQ